MTVIVWKDGIMAADTAAWEDTICVTTDCHKIHRIRDGSLIGCCGEWGEIERFVRWMDAGQPDPKPDFAQGDDDGFGALVVSPLGRVTTWTEKMVEQVATGESGMVIGTSHKYLMGMLLAGLSAEEAVALAIERCAYVGGHVESMRLDDVEVAEPEPEVVQADDWRVRRGLA